MPLSAATTLLLTLTVSCVQADVTFVGSKPAHHGSVAMASENETCKTAGEAALRCEKEEECIGIWFHDSGSVKQCQVVNTCPLQPSKINPVSDQAGFYFLFTGTFTKGDYSKYKATMIYIFGLKFTLKQKRHFLSYSFDVLLNSPHPNLNAACMCQPTKS